MTYGILSVLFRNSKYTIVVSGEGKEGGHRKMGNPARRNWGNDDLKPGDIVFIWGKQKTPYRVKNVTKNTVIVNTIWSQNRTTDALRSNVRFADVGKDEFFRQRRYHSGLRKKQRDEAKSREDGAKDELWEFVRFLNSDPKTEINSEMWKRFRELSPTARAEFFNAGLKIPSRWL
jgi:hypothetical protein